MELEPCIVLAQQIMDVIRASGMTKVQAFGALSIAGTLLSSADDVTLMRHPSDDQETVAA